MSPIIKEETFEKSIARIVNKDPPAKGNGIMLRIIFTIFVVSVDQLCKT